MKWTLKAARVNAGYTQEQVSKILNVNRNTISRYEIGSHDVPVAKAQAMARLYGVKIEDIFFTKKLRVNRN